MSSGNRRIGCRLPARIPFIAVLVMGPALAVPAFALVQPRPEATDARVIPAPQLEVVPEEAPEGGTGPAAPVAAAFRGRHAGPWRMTFDRRTGRPTLVEGRGIPFLQDRAIGLDDAAPLGLSFIDAEGELLRTPGGELRLNRERSGWLDEGRVVFLDYDWYVDGIPVDGARVFLRANRGNVIQMGSARIGRAAPRAAPVLDADAALDRLFEQAGGRDEGDVVIATPSLVYVARETGGGHAPWGGGLAYRLAWRAAFRRAGEAATWTGDVDARTGEVLSFDDSNRYARVTGGVFPRSPNETEQTRPFNNVRVVAGGASIVTGDTGTFPYTAGPAHMGFDGAFFRLNCEGCTTPERAFAFTREGTGDLELGTGGVDTIGNGASTPAERNAFFHLNRVRNLARKWLSIGWLNQLIVTNVNIDDVCNAFWNGELNFFRSGGGCSNTGTIADVMYHEWGHGLDQNTNIGDGSTGEATGDITSMHVVHDARVGPYFETNGNPVRDLDSARVGYVASIANLNSFCLVCQPGQCTNGPLGHEVHCEGEIYGQAHWELAQALVAKYGYNTGWQELERIYFLSLPQADTMLATQAQNVYGAYLAVDDDNGNLADGTPNCLEIYNTFNTHGIAGTACAGNTPHCVRPAQPSMTITPGHGRVILDWTTVPAATQYTVLRADFSAAQVYMALATQPGTHFEDATVQPGVTYWYVVESRTAGGCRSTIENAVATAALPDSRPLLAATVVDDVPAGNRSGFADPGESIDVTLGLRNALPAGAAGGGTGTLTTATPNVAMTTGAATWAPITPGATVTGSAFRAALGPGLECGRTIDFTLAYDDGGGGTPAAASVPVLVGERVTRYFQDFDAGPAGWTTSAGVPAATQGQWLQGDPVGTTWQAEDDAGAAPGGQCLFTGQNSSDSTGDIDGGETIVTSPVINLAGAGAARLSYRRWWASSSLTDAGDAVVVEVSGNGGGSWVAAETVSAGARNLGWQPVDIRLESLVPLTSTFQVRVRARDTNLDSNVEAALDDVRVEEVVCDLTPPCFVAPAFAGLATAAQGASCAETDLTWPAGGTNCQNAAITYNVYRSTIAGFAPAPANRVAAGLSGLAFHDTLLAPGTIYHYVVRADDSRSGEEANAVERSVTAPLAPDTVAPVYGGLATLQPGLACGTTELQWLPALETCSVPLRYDVYRSVVPGFVPGASNLVATVAGTTYVDTALVPGQAYYYEVRARDTAGNEEGNTTEAGTPARNLPFILYHADFEANDGQWTGIAPNDAALGRFEWADPQGTGAQPEDDATPAPGVKAWVTGPLAGGGLGAFDVDTGTTTIASPIVDITGRPSPQLILSAYFNNDFGANPGEDPFRIDVSANGGTSWTPVLNTLTDIDPWTTLQFAITPTVPATSQFRVRVQTQDLGIGGSLVEAGIDEVTVLQPDAGCAVCTGPVAGVGTILVTTSGNDVVVDWSADPVAAPAYDVYLRHGPGFGTSVRAGTTTTKSFVHAGGALFTGENFYYEVTAIDACGRESPAP